MGDASVSIDVSYIHIYTKPMASSVLMLNQMAVGVEKSSAPSRQSICQRAMGRGKIGKEVRYLWFVGRQLLYTIMILIINNVS